MSRVASRIGYFTAAYTIFFTCYALIERNYEFLFYSLIILVMLFGVVAAYRRIYLSHWIIVGMSLFGFVHLLGGSARIGGVRLYDLEYLNGSLHFDNIVHAIGIFLATLVIYNILAPFLDERVHGHYALLYFILLLTALGVGTVNELIELFAVVFLGAGESVGDYLNNALDLVFNAIGSIVAIALIHRSISKKRRIELA